MAITFPPVDQSPWTNPETGKQYIWKDPPGAWHLADDELIDLTQAVINLEEEIEVIAPSHIRGLYDFTTSNPPETGSFTCNAMRYGEITEVEIHQTDVLGIDHSLTNIEVTDHLEIFDLNDAYGMESIVDEILEIGSGYVKLRVSVLKSLDPEDGSDIVSERVQIKCLETLDNKVDKKGDIMSGRLTLPEEMLGGGMLTTGGSGGYNLIKDINLNNLSISTGMYAFRGLAIASDGTTWFTIGFNNNTYKPFLSTDSGATWTAVNSPYVNQTIVHWCYYYEPQDLFCVPVNRGIHFYNKDGTAAGAVQPWGNTNGTDVKGIGQIGTNRLLVSNNKGQLFGSNGDVLNESNYTSLNIGQDSGQGIWDYTYLPSQNDSTDFLRAVSGGGGQVIYKKGDSGSWTTVIPGSNSTSMFCIKIVEPTPGDYTVFTGSNSGLIFWSKDFITWSHKDLGSSVRRIYYNGGDDVWAVGECGIWKTSDFGENWTFIAKPLSSTDGISMGYNATGDFMVVGRTFTTPGNVAYYSTDSDKFDLLWEDDPLIVQEVLKEITASSTDFDDFKFRVSSLGN